VCTKSPLSRRHVFPLTRSTQEWRSVPAVEADVKWRLPQCPPHFSIKQWFMSMCFSIFFEESWTSNPLGHGGLLQLLYFKISIEFLSASIAAQGWETVYQEPYESRSHPCSCIWQQQSPISLVLQWEKEIKQLPLSLKRQFSNDSYCSFPILKIYVFIYCVFFIIAHC